MYIGFKRGKSKYSKVNNSTKMAYIYSFYSNTFF